MDEDIFKGLGVKIKLIGKFDHVREVLTRIGVVNRSKKTLTQTCHLFHKRGEYAIMHFLEMFEFDGKPNNIGDEDYIRRNHIVAMLIEWGMVELDDDLEIKKSDEVKVSVLPYKTVKEENWTLKKNYTIGKG